MLPRIYRAKKDEIEEALKTGKTIGGGLFYAKVLKKREGAPHFAVIVSKKVEKTSVGRHLLKRRISAVLEKNLPKLKGVPGIFVFLANKIPKNPDFSHIQLSVEEILEKAGAFVS